MQISTLIFLIVILTLPIITIYKKFDRLNKFLFGDQKIRLPKLSISFSILSKMVVYLLLALKLFFTLYMLFYIVTNNPILSIFFGLIALGVIVVFIYVFAHIRVKLQNAVLYIAGSVLTTVMFLIFSFVTIVFLFYSIKNLSFELLKPASILIVEDLILALITTFVSYFFARNTSDYIQSLQGKPHHIFNKIFYFIGRIPSVILGFMSYLIITKFSPKFFSNGDNILTKVVICCAIQGILYSPVIVTRIINHRNSTPTKILDNFYEKFSFSLCFIQIFFEMNLFVQFLFFNKEIKHFFTENYVYAIVNDINMIYPVCLLCFIIYGLHFIVRRKNYSDLVN